MRKNVPTISAAAIAAIFSINAYAYDKAKITNMAPWPAVVTVKYAACKGESFKVPASTKAQPGVATSPLKRGGCLITSISAKIVDKDYPVTSYTAPKGTSFSEFIIAYVPPYEIKGKKELGEEAWGINLKNTLSPEGDYGR